jgi:hypothetical protein
LSRVQNPRWETELLKGRCAFCFLIVCLAALLGLGGEASGISFPDVSATSQYHAAIATLVDRGVIGGYANGDFGPNDRVTRQQFAKMIVKALGLEVTGSEPCPFDDVTPRIGADPWYPATYVAVCAAEGIATGESATTFDPLENITRNQLISMVVRAMDTLSPGTLLDAPGEWSGILSYADKTHGPNVMKAEFNHLLDGVLPQDLPSDWQAGCATRGEVAQILWNACTAMAGDPPSITALSPASGPTSGATVVTVTGTGFERVRAVTMGGQAAEFTVDSPTQISAITPGLGGRGAGGYRARHKPRCRSLRIHLRRVRPGTRCPDPDRHQPPRRASRDSG